MAIPYKEQKLPAVQQLAFDVTRWGGVNRIKGSTQDYEMADCVNMAVDHFPYAAPRKSRKKLCNFGVIGSGNRIVNIDGDRLYYLYDLATGGVLYENVICCLEQGSVTMLQDEDGAYITVPDVNCTANYDGNMLFFPDMRCYSSGIWQALSAALTFDTQYTENVSGGSSYRYCERFYSEEHTYEGRFGTDIIVQLQRKYTSFSTFADEFANNYQAYPGVSKYLKYMCLVYDAEGTKIAELSIPFVGKAIAETTSGSYTYSASVNGSDATLKFGFGSALQDEGSLTVRFAIECGTSATNYGKFSSRVISGFVNGCTHTLSLSASQLVPAVDYGVVYNNRVVGVCGSEVRASALGDFLDFSTFVDEDGNPDATGAYATNVGSDGRFTGIAAYNNVLLLFKRNIVYQMYGSMPYTMTEISNTGCIDHDSICEIDGVLYWASNKGIVKFTGGTPAVISYPAGIALTDVCKSGTDGRRYYCYNGERIYVYDTWYGLWHIEDSPAVKQFYTEGDGLYMLCDDGIYLLGSGTERVAWEFETKDYTFDVKERKNLSKLWARVFMERNSRLEVYVRSDGGAYSRVAHYQADRDSMFDFKVRVKKCDSFTLKFKGEGDVRLLDLHGRVTVSSSKHRSGQNLSVFRR